MAEKLLVIVGAGASMMVGAPSTADVTKAVREIEQKVEIPIPDGLFRTKRVLEQVYQVLLQGYSAPNFETMVHALEVVQSLIAGWQPDATDRQRPVEAILCGGPRGGRATSLFDGLAVGMASEDLYRKVHELFTSVSTLARTHDDWGKWKNFWTKLDQNFDLDIATLNYDTLIEAAFAAEHFDEGFRPKSAPKDARFCPREFSQENKRLRHLHGSICFGPISQSRNSRDDLERFEKDEVRRFSDPNDALSCWRSTERSGNRSQAGRFASVGPLITGLDKTAKVFVVEPYRTYHHSLYSVAEQTPRLLVIGYSFGDLHVNAVINHFWRIHGDESRVAIIDYWNDWKRSDTWREERPVLYEAISRLGHDQMPMDDVERPNPWRSRNGRCLVTTLGLKDAAENHMATLLEHLRQ